MNAPAAEPRRKSRARALDRNRSNVKVVIDWLRYNFFEDRTKQGASCGSLSKASVYNQYLHFCKTRGLPPATGPVFGKIVRMAFPDIKYCRKGTRSAAKHHYKYLVRRWPETPQEGANSDEAGWSSESEEGSRSGSDDENKAGSPKDEEALVYDVAASNVLPPAPAETDAPAAQERVLYLLPEETLLYSEAGSFSEERVPYSTGPPFQGAFVGQEDSELQHYLSRMLLQEDLALESAEKRYFSASPLVLPRCDTPSLDDLLRHESGRSSAFRPPTPFLDVLGAQGGVQSGTPHPSSCPEAQTGPARPPHALPPHSHSYAFIPSSPRGRQPEVRHFADSMPNVPTLALKRGIAKAAPNGYACPPSCAPSSFGPAQGPRGFEAPQPASRQTSEEISFFVAYEHYFRDLIDAVREMKLNTVEGLTQRFWEKYGRHIQYTPENVDLMAKIDRHHYGKLAEAAMANTVGLSNASLSSVLAHFAEFLKGSVERATAPVLPPHALSVKLREVLSFSAVLKRRAQFVGGC